jgi:hypothetical protein
VADGLINMDELLNAVYGTGFRGGVEIAAESCFSGNLCYKAKEWCEKNMDKLMEKDTKFYVSVSSCASRHLKA